MVQCIWIMLTGQTVLPPDEVLQETPLGFKYIKHTDNQGNTPQPGQVVLFHAQMRNGKKVHFSSRQYASTPAIEIPESDTATEWSLPDVQVLMQLTKGDSATTFLRIDTVANKPRGFENSDWIAYDIVCVDIMDKAVWEKQQAAMQVDADRVHQLIDSLLTVYQKKRTRSTMPLVDAGGGMQYLVLSDGDGNFPLPGQSVVLHYAAYLRQGRLVDRSIGSEPFRFTLGEGQVIDGWEQGIPLLREGTEAVFFIPPRLAYGEKGVPPAVPPFATMIYFIKLLSIE